jgi:hypothetical protein
MKIHINEEDLQYIKLSINNGEVLQEDLGRWFKEKWVDVSKKVNGKHPPCGRSDADGENVDHQKKCQKILLKLPLHMIKRKRRR